MTPELVIETLKNAYIAQSPWKGLLLHKDLGLQYTSSEFTRCVHNYEMKQSFSQKGCLYDNPYQATLKKATVYHT